MDYRKEVEKDLDSLVEVGALSKAKCAKVKTYLDTEAGRQTLAECEAGGASIMETTEMVTFLADVH